MDNLIEFGATNPIRGWTLVGEEAHDYNLLGNLSDALDEQRKVDWYLSPNSGLYAFHPSAGNVNKVSAYLSCWPDVEIKVGGFAGLIDPYVGVEAALPPLESRGVSNLVDPDEGAEQPVADWLQKAFERLQRLMILPVGWDGEGGQSVTSEAASAVFEMLSHLAQKTPLEPALVPTREGRVQLEWHETAGDLEVEVAADGKSFDIWYFDAKADTDRDEHLESLRHAEGAIDALLTVIASRV